jgi:hypothetical protein
MFERRQACPASQSRCPGSRNEGGSKSGRFRSRAGFPEGVLRTKSGTRHALAEGITS